MLVAHQGFELGAEAEAVEAPESVWETLSDRLEAEREGEGWAVGGRRGRLSGETGASCNESFGEIEINYKILSTRSESMK